MLCMTLHRVQICDRPCLGDWSSSEEDLKHPVLVGQVGKCWLHADLSRLEISPRLLHHQGNEVSKDVIQQGWTLNIELPWCYLLGAHDVSHHWCHAALRY